MTTLRERLTEVFTKKLQEAHENSKEMIASNSTSFDEMGMSHTAPGEFAQEEITDHANLENTGSMANDTEFSGKVDCCDSNSECEVSVSAAVDEIDDTMNSLASDIVDISVKDDEEPESEEDSEEEDEDEKRLMSLAKESVKDSLKIAFKKQLKESDYAGPLSFVPDTRLNTSDVLNELKKKIGEGSEAIHVDQDEDEEGNKTWCVTQVDEKKLPETLEVVNVKLKKDGNKYKVDGMAKDFPAMK